jgi:hypothetical protein
MGRLVRDGFALNGNYQGGMFERNFGLEVNVSGCQGVKRET